MPLAVSQIGWSAEQDDALYRLLPQQGIAGLEIAPSRFVGQAQPYLYGEQAAAHASTLCASYGLCIPSMQSIWFGRTERLFGTLDEYAVLMDYTRQAIRFAAAVHCPHLVFGCPKNRITASPDDVGVASAFFRAIGDYAAPYAVTLGIEANPPIYGTNYLNTTPQVAQLVRQVAHPAIRINLDIGTMVENGESVDELTALLPLVSHVHLSEPHLVPIMERSVHRQLAAVLRDCGYTGFVSLEMRQDAEGSLLGLQRSIDYLHKVFGDE